MSVEEDGGQAANKELDSLLLQAGALDGDLAELAPEAQAAQAEALAVVSLAQKNSEGVSALLAMAIPLLSQFYPSLVEVYTPEACGAVAASLGPVMAKYNIDMQEWGGRYQEEIGAAFVCVPIALATAKAIKADVLAARPQTKDATTVEHKPVAPAKGAAKALKPGDYGYVEANEAPKPGAAVMDSMTEFQGA